MDNIEYLFAGFAVFWAGLFIYLVLLQARIRSLTREIERLEERLAEAEGAPARTPAGAASATPPASGPSERREAAEQGA